MYTDEQIENLISCPKNVIEADRDFKEVRGSYKRSFSLISTDNTYNFTGFISKNKRFPENFSIGLVYTPKEEKGRICLLRCNGLHGGTLYTHHAVCHIHTVLAKDLNDGIKAEKNIIITKDYSTIDDAIQFYVKRIGINLPDRKKYFPPPSGELKLFGNE